MGCWTQVHIIQRRHWSSRLGQRVLQLQISVDAQALGEQTWVPLARVLLTQALHCSADIPFVGGEQRCKTPMYLCVAHYLAAWTATGTKTSLMCSDPCLFVICHQNLIFKKKSITSVATGCGRPQQMNTTAVGWQVLFSFFTNPSNKALNWTNLGTNPLKITTSIVPIMALECYTWYWLGIKSN